MVTYILSERKSAYEDTQLKVLKYSMKQNSDILWYPIKNVDSQFTKKNGVYLPNDLKFLSGTMIFMTKIWISSIYALLCFPVMFKCPP